VELVATDTAPDGADVAIRRLTETEHAFALIATQLPDDARDLDPGEPVVGVLGGPGPPRLPRVFRIAAPIEDRVIMLLRQLAPCDDPPPRIAVIGSAEAAGLAIFDASPYAKAKVAVNWPDPTHPKAAVAAAAKAGVDAILVFGHGETVASVATAMGAQDLSLPLLAPGQPGDDVVASAIAARAFASAPFIRWAFAGLAPTQTDATDFTARRFPRQGYGRVGSRRMRRAREIRRDNSTAHRSYARR
jgi:hypothetical protein